MKKYDVVIPLGNFCSASFHLRHNNLQLESYPFDWVGFDNIRFPANLLANNFVDFFRPNDLKRVDGENGNHLPYIQYPEHFLFYHCIEKDLPFEDACSKANDMFKRRIDRLYERINNAKSILFVNTSNELVTENDALEALKILQNRFPDKIIDLIVIDLKKTYKNLEIKELNNHLTFAKLEFDNATNQYSDKKKEFSQILKNRKLSSQKNVFFSKIHKKILFLKRIFINTLCCLIPVKKYRKAIRKKFNISTQDFNH